MQHFSISPVEMMGSFWRNRNLIWVLTKRDVVGRYRGSIMGLAWSFFNPVLMLVVYTFVFSVVFKARWNMGSDSKAEFSLILFAGLIVFNFFSECMNRAPSLIMANGNYVKKVVFPLEILPWVALGAALFHAAISFLVWLCAYIICFGVPVVTVLLFPVVVVPLLLVVVGLSWILAALGVYLRDVSQIVGVFTGVLMFVSPVFYPVSSLPLQYQSWMLINPLTPIIEITRDVLFFGKMPDPLLIAVYIVGSFCLSWLGFALFQKVRRGFADVL